MITRFRVQNYKALRDVTLDLTPVHVLIGPNDSGKTSILEAMAALCRSVDHPVAEAFRGCFQWKYGYIILESQWDKTVQGIENQEFYGYRSEFSLDCDDIEGRQQAVKESLLNSKGDALDLHPNLSSTALFNRRGSQGQDSYNLKQRGFPADFMHRIADQMSGVQFYRFSPEWLKVSVTLSPHRQGRMEFNGFGLPQLLDEIRNDRDRYTQLEKRFSELFPYVAAIELPVREAYEASAVDFRRVKLAEYTGGKGIEFRLVDGRQKLPAENASDGMLFVLAYLALLHLPNPPRVLLIEEPENGIHPGRLKEIIRIIKQLVSEQNHTQVVMTTHSPYVLHEFSPEEVTVCVREENGEVKTRRLSESKSVQEQIGFFSLGEIWTMDGDERLLQPIDNSVAAAEAPEVQTAP